ncbi:MAG: addiction module toxin, HicA family [Planctomycetota bacterium]|nr:MAG: addiction module toxin, HicA family [Planctomycetota bacterium]
MSRKELLKHLRRNGCELLREGRAHSVWVNPANQQQASIPRHKEINDYTARAICRQLGVPEP